MTSKDVIFTIFSGVLIYIINVNFFANEPTIKTVPPQLSSQYKEKLHKVVLNTFLKEDQMLYAVLKESNYTCYGLDKQYFLCNLLKKKEPRTAFQLKKADQLFNYTSLNGKAFQLYKAREGDAHLKVTSSNGESQVYSFTSFNNLSYFAKKYGVDYFSKEINSEINDLRSMF